MACFLLMSSPLGKTHERLAPARRGLVARRLVEINIFLLNSAARLCPIGAYYAADLVFFKVIDAKIRFVLTVYIVLL